MAKISLIICSLDREKSLNRLLKAIEEQTFKDYEIILCQEEGRLAELKEKSWQKAKGEIVLFCDDDIMPAHSEWLEYMVNIFDYRKDIIGVTGPTFVPKEYLKNRDIFRGGILKWFYNWFFLEGKVFYPGKITSCGANTLGGDYDTEISNKPYEVDFLQPAQFAVRRDMLLKVNGFDTNYRGIAEWFDVDLCYRIRKYGKLIYHPEIKVYHYPVKDVTTNKRLETASRYQNYCRWADRYIKKSFRHYIYRLFLLIYFKLKSWKLI